MASFKTGELRENRGRKGPGCAGWRLAEPPGGLLSRARGGRGQAGLGTLGLAGWRGELTQGRGDQSEVGNPGEARARPRGRENVHGGPVERPGSRPRGRMGDSGSSTSNAVQKSRNASTAKSPEFRHSRSKV